MDAYEVFLMMDRYGAEGRPFLFAVDFEMREGLFWENPLERDDVYFSVRGVTNGKTAGVTGRKPELEVLYSDKEGYRRGFGIVMDGILRGDSFLTNLTAATEVRCNLGLEEIFSRSGAPYRICVPGRFVCFSPEPFVRVSEDGIISTFPMKGTADATQEGALERLMGDYKELCEHYTITDLMRNDLSMVSDNVRVESFRYVERIRTFRGEILQTSSHISGRAGTDWRVRCGEMFSKLLPAGSVSGAPKSSVLRLISLAENGPRGFYTGVFGYFDGRTLDSAVMIRYMELDSCGRMLFRSGGGITVNSRMEDEYAEVLEKVYLAI